MRCVFISRIRHCTIRTERKGWIGNLKVGKHPKQYGKGSTDQWRVLASSLHPTSKVAIEMNRTEESCSGRRRLRGTAMNVNDYMQISLYLYLKRSCKRATLSRAATSFQLPLVSFIEIQKTANEPLIQFMNFLVSQSCSWVTLTQLSWLVY